MHNQGGFCHTSTSPPCNVDAWQLKNVWILNLVSRKQSKWIFIVADFVVLFFHSWWRKCRPGSRRWSPCWSGLTGCTRTAPPTCQTRWGGGLWATRGASRAQRSSRQWNKHNFFSFISRLASFFKRAIKTVSRTSLTYVVTSFEDQRHCGVLGSSFSHLEFLN